MALGAAGAGARGAASRVAGGVSTAYRLGGASGSSPAARVAGGLAGVGRTTAYAAASPLRRAAAEASRSYRAGARAAFVATGGAFSRQLDAAVRGDDGAPAWARRLRRQQALHQGLATAAHALRGGDGGGTGTSVSLREKP